MTETNVGFHQITLNVSDNLYLLFERKAKESGKPIEAYMLDLACDSLKRGDARDELMECEMMDLLDRPEVAEKIKEIFHDRITSMVEEADSKIQD